MTDDGQSYKYVYDVFGRVKTVKNQSNTVIAEYQYNGLGYRIAFQEDTDNDGDADGSDKTFWIAYDEGWRILSVFRESDTSPKEEFVNQLAGFDGFGGSSMLDGVVCRYKDANTAWTDASDSVLEQRYYYCQNWRGDVSAIITSSGTMVEWVKYSSYGMPFGLPAGDTDSDGDCDTTDVGQILTWANAPAYDVRGDLDLDGDVDSTDRSNAITNFQGTTLGWGVLSANNVKNRKGYGGYERDVNFAKIWHVRNRVLDSELGRWTRRDPLGYEDSPSLYELVGSQPISSIDPMGLAKGVVQNPVGSGAKVWVDGKSPTGANIKKKEVKPGQSTELIGVDDADLIIFCCDACCAILPSVCCATFRVHDSQTVKPICDCPPGGPINITVKVTQNGASAVWDLFFWNEKLESVAFWSIRRYIYGS